MLFTKTANLFPISMSNTRCRFSWIALYLLGCTAFGCVQDKQKLVAEKVAERVMEYKNKRHLECWQNLMVKAEKKVDSLLLAEAQQALQDSLSRLRPFKPNQPPPVPAIDSLAVKPLFDGTPKKGG